LPLVEVAKAEKEAGVMPATTTQPLYASDA
jgi:hypothetical protein